LPELSRTLSVYAIVAACKLLMTAKMTAVEIMGAVIFIILFFGLRYTQQDFV
jgi:hypothetical protein